jgi:hypothetical protein
MNSLKWISKLFQVELNRETNQGETKPLEPDPNTLLEPDSRLSEPIINQKNLVTYTFDFFQMGRKGNKKRAARQKYVDPTGKKYGSQSEMSDSEPEVMTSEAIPENSILISNLPNSQPRPSLLSQQATKLHHPQPVQVKSTMEEVLGKPTISTEQKLSQSIDKSGMARPIKNSLSRSIPKSIPRRSSVKVATPSSIFLQTHRKSIAESDSDNDYSRQEVAEIVAEHLVQPDEIAHKMSGTSFGSMSHQLVGGIYY